MFKLLRDRTLCIVFSITVLMTMGVASVIPVLPSLARIFDVSHASVVHVLTLFTVPGAIFMPLAGIWADRYGRKALLMPALLLFGLAGVGCALSPNFETLLFFRFLQGLGVTPLAVLYLTIIGDTYQGAERVKMMGYNAAVLSIGTAVCPALGGALAEVHWRLVFCLPLLSLAVIWLASKHTLAGPAQESSLKDYFESTLRVLRSRKTLVLLCLTFLTFMMLYGPIITSFPHLADHLHGASPSTIGGIVAISSFSAALIASTLGKLSTRFSPRTLLLSSQCFYLVALFSIPFVANIWLMPLPIFLFGMGQGLNMPTINTIMVGQAEQSQRGAIMAVNGLALRLSQTLAPLFFGMIGFVFGIESAFFAGAGMALLMMALLLGSGVR